MSRQHQRRAQALDAWESDLCQREAALADAERRFAERVETLVDHRATGLAEAMELVRSVFPEGIVFEPWGQGSGGSAH